MSTLSKFQRMKISHTVCRNTLRLSNCQEEEHHLALMISSVIWTSKLKDTHFFFGKSLPNSFYFVHRAYNDYEDENYAKAGLDLVKVFIKTFTTVNAVKRSGPPPDYKSMGGALSINVSFFLSKHGLSPQSNFPHLI